MSGKNGKERMNSHIENYQESFIGITDAIMKRFCEIEERIDNIEEKISTSEKEITDKTELTQIVEMGGKVYIKMLIDDIRDVLSTSWTFDSLQLNLRNCLMDWERTNGLDKINIETASFDNKEYVDIVLPDGERIQVQRENHK